MEEEKKKGRPKKEVEPVVQPKVKTISFEQWAARKNIPIHHRSGMKAAIKNPSLARTEAEWDKFFENY